MNRPLVPEDLDREPFVSRVREGHITTLVRACIAVGRSALNKQVRPFEFAAKTWPNDRNVELLLRAASPPHSTTSVGIAVARTTQAFLPALTPISAGADLLQRGLGLNFNGAASILVPSIALPVCDFVGEGAGIPVQPAPTGTEVTLVPHKLAVITTLTGEMMLSANAEPMVRQVLIESTGPAIDKQLFSNVAGDAIRPAGLLNGVTPLPPSAGGGDQAQAMVDDIAALATAVAPVAGNSNIVLIAASPQAVGLAMRPIRGVPYEVLMSGTLAAGTVIAVAVNTLVTAVEGAPRIDATPAMAVTVHEDTVPLPLVDAGGVVAKPIRSTYQTDSVGLRLRWPISWSVRDPRGISYMTSVSW